MEEVVLIFPLTLNRVRSEDGRQSIVHLPFRLLHLDIPDVDRERWKSEEGSNKIGSMADDGVVEDVRETTRMLTNDVSK